MNDIELLIPNQNLYHKGHNAHNGWLSYVCDALSKIFTKDGQIEVNQDLRSSKSFATNYANFHEFLKQFACISEIRGWFFRALRKSY